MSMSVNLSKKNLASDYMHSDQFADELRDRLSLGADFWRANARKRTGFMAEHVREVVVMEREGYEGWLEMDAEYAEYQEEGFHHYQGGYVEGMHLTHDIVAIISGAQ